MFSKFIACILIIAAFIKSLFYGIYEINNNNKIAGKAFIAISFFSLLFPLITLFIW